MSDSSQQKAASPETQQVKDGATSKDPPKKSKLTSIVTKEEIRRYVDLGLGRGVDATNPKPWLNKSSFQVRRVAIESVIGTEEGGALQSYEREITSVQTQQTDLKASIAVPRSPVNIGVDAEQSRSTSSRRRAVGKKVINRTISFRVGFEDAPSSSAAHLGSAREATAVSSSMGGAVFQSEAATFEERLTYWIMVRVQERRDLAAMKTGTEGSSTALDSPRVYSGNPVADLAEVILNSSVEERKAILKDCREFVNHFRITHYVSAIELGATEYRVLTETEYYHRVDLAGTLGIDLIGSAAVSEALSLKKSSRSSDLKRVGVVSDKGKVERGTYDEAVVGVALEPISSVVKLCYLRLALRKALLDYMQEQSDTSDGPFVISCDDNKLFLTVNTQDYTVLATREAENASLFFIEPDEDSGRPYEFVITYIGDAETAVLKRQTSRLSLTSEKVVEPLARYLSVPSNFAGYYSGPLRLYFTTTHSDTRLTLQSRLVKRSAPIDTSEWVRGNDAFYINCAHTVLKKNGYVCVRRRRGAFTTSCVPRKSYHNETDTWMVFRLLPHSYRNKARTPVEPSAPSIDPQQDSELLDYETTLDKNALPLRPLQTQSSSTGVSFSIEGTPI